METGWGVAGQGTGWTLGFQVFPAWRDRGGLYFLSFIEEEPLLALYPSHPLLSPDSCAPSQPIPLGFCFPPICLSPVFWNLLMRAGCPSLFWVPGATIGSGLGLSS